MKLTVKFLIVFAVFFLAFTNRASADFSFGNQHSDHGDKWGNHDQDRDHHHQRCSSGSGSGGGVGSHGGIAPEPVSYVLFLFGAGILALSYRQRSKLQTA